MRSPDLRWALSFITPHWRRLLLVMVLSLMSTALSLYLPYLSKNLVDHALIGRNLDALVRIVALFAAVTAISFILNVVSGLRYTRVSADILFQMRLAVYQHLQQLSPRFYARTRMGDIVSRINADIGEIQRIASEAVMAWVGNGLFLIGTTAMLIWLDARLFLASLVLLPPTFWALIEYRRRLEGAVTAMRERSADIGSFLIETIQGVKLVVASNAQQREATRFSEKNDSFIAALMSMRKLTYLSGGLPGLLLALNSSIVFLYGGWRVVTGAITMGTLVAFVAYQMRLLGPVQALMGLYASLATAKVSLGRVRDVVDNEIEVREISEPIQLIDAWGELALEDVTFVFDRETTVLDRVSLHVPAGRTLAIVGPSGSGKSTIVDLLSRHLDPDEGRILLDGYDLRTLQLADVRRHIVAVDQQPFVFNASIAENIRYARPDASEADVAEAATRAALDEFVRTLPKAYETLVGERGQALSAGERQRVAIARAFLADPAVLVLDEATASLDPIAESLVVRGYESLMRDRTTVLVTHRLDLASKADTVVVLRSGSIVEEGSPGTLLAAKSEFHALFAKR